MSSVRTTPLPKPAPLRTGAAPQTAALSRPELYLGLDVGSTTVKTLVMDDAGNVLFARYQRHLSEVRSTVARMLQEIKDAFPCKRWAVAASGSGAIALSQELNILFVQEVVASGLCIRRLIPDADAAIELGGEDAKLTFFTGGFDQRMNETCAGGTGAFIDQMAGVINTDTPGLDAMAQKYTTLYPIASRCGVFAKTDILPLLNEGCAREDIAASIMQSVVEQTVSGLARGRAITGKVVFLGGPLAFLPSLRQRFVETLNLDEEHAVFPQYAEYFVAMGAALHALSGSVQGAGNAAGALLPMAPEDKGNGGGNGGNRKSYGLPPPTAPLAWWRTGDDGGFSPPLSARGNDNGGNSRDNGGNGGDNGDGPACISLEALLADLAAKRSSGESEHLPPLFSSPEELGEFRRRHQRDSVERFSLELYEGDAWLGFDSGSTTLKAVLLDDKARLLYSFYGPNNGDPLASALAVLREIYARKRPGLRIKATAVTGYGFGLLQAGLGADIDEVETVAHYAGARFFLPEVSFILDIGGQDIKCMRIRNNAIDRIQLNEACSAGCGSFIESFAKSLDMPLADFVGEALSAKNPVDLGTRCTVFMNSKVKQAQKDGAAVGDIAAGLSYSVVRNACYKVMKISGPEELGDHVVVQGGAFANDALLRTFELQVGHPVVRPDIAGLMGAFGAALIARERGAKNGETSLLNEEALAAFSMKTATARCRKCGNTCLLTVTTFADKGRFISGNRCERGAGSQPNDLPNLYHYKYSRLFDPYVPLEREKARRGVVGIPRALNIYENYPLWFTMFNALGFRVELSSPSSKQLFFQGYGTIPSQTVCYPAKLAHGHILDLIERKVDYIFFPCLPLEMKNFNSQAANYNCPVVIGYPELLANNIGELKTAGIPLIHQFLPLDQEFLSKRLRDIPLFSSIPYAELDEAVRLGFAEMQAFKDDIARAGERALEELYRRDAFGLVLAGHPYHVDPEVHHGIPGLINSVGMGVLTEDSVAHLMPDPGLMRVVDQWTYHSRLYRAGAYAAGTDNLAVLQLVSFGCGLDAITSDQLEEMVTVKGRLYGQIKIDEGANLGPARIRIRSLLAALRDRKGKQNAPTDMAVYRGSPPYTLDMRDTHTILIPQLSPLHFQFLETIFSCEGYKVEQLATVNRDAVELGLRHVNNDACYPAIVVIGQLLHAIRSGQYDPSRIALMISQTGGGCRATNYIAFLRKALVDCGLEHIPIISFNVEGMDTNPGFKLTGRLLRRAVMGGYYGDVLMRVLHRTQPYELVPGSAAALADQWAERAKQIIASASPWRFHMSMTPLVRDFDRLPLITEERKPRVGLVGEILLKYHPDANNRAAEVVEREGGEAVVPDLMDFVLYSSYDNVFRYRHLAGDWKSYASALTTIAFLEYCRWSMRRALTHSKRFTPPLRFSELRRKAKSLISLGHQTGEGWLLTAEMVELLESGVSNILCMQPFGCLPNHITGKGLLKELKHRYPEANIAAVDYDPGASEVNQINRIKLMMSVAR